MWEKQLIMRVNCTAVYSLMKSDFIGKRVTKFKNVHNMTFFWGWKKSCLNLPAAWTPDPTPQT